MVNENESSLGGRSQLCFDAIPVSLPQIRAYRVQTRVPALELGQSNAVLGVDLVAVVACHDGVVLLTR